MTGTTHRTRILTAATVLAAGLGIAAVQAPPAAADVTGTAAWTAPGSYVWTVPAGVDTTEFDLSGGQGGYDSGLPGGLAGELHAAVAVTPGEQLYIVVGGQGAAAQTVTTYPGACSAPGGLGGYGGGGAGGSAGGGWTCVPGAGGGGESAIVTSGGTAADRILVAAGGGGASQEGTGGDGGGIEGAIGQGDVPWPTGGSQTAGGTPGQDGSQGGLGATDGIPVNGGGGGSLNAIQYQGEDIAYGGGGGGAGWYGGGGGAIGSGGGGSNYVIPTASSVVDQGGVHGGNGAVSVTYGGATAPTITADSPGPATVGQPYSYSFQATGFPTPQWSVAGSLPPGLRLAPNGQVSGTPTSAGAYTVNVVADSAGGLQEAQVTFQIVAAEAPPTFVPGPTPKATIGTSYSHRFVFQGSPTPQVVLHAGALPPGLTLSSGGTLSGTPTKAGTYFFTVAGVNGVLPSAHHNAKLVVRPLPGLSIADASVTEPASGSESLKLHITLSPASKVPVTVDWSTFDGTAKAGVDYRAASGQVTIAAGTKKATITVTVLADTLFRPSETFLVVLASPSGAMLNRPTANVTIT